MNDLTNLKKIISGAFLALSLLMPERVLSEERAEAEVKVIGKIKSEGSIIDDKQPESGSTQSQYPSLSYNSFKEERGWVDQFWGRPFRDRLYFGMWTLHLESRDDQESNNQLIGGTYKGYYGGTFINTHRDRVWSGGCQRTLFQKSYGGVEVEAGYRVGIMYGYKRYLKLGNSKFFPLFQTLLDIGFPNISHNAGIELSWAGVVFSAGFFYRF